MGHYEQERNYLEAERACVTRDGLASVLSTISNRHSRRIPTTPVFTFSVQSEYAVVDRDPEFADMGNPNGDIIRERFFMVAADEVGHMFRYGWEETPEAAEFAFQNFAPIVSEWPLWRCEYGSKAWASEGCELDELRREMEEDLGPDWMNHPHVSLELVTLLA